jgi:FtsZ-interacting cell division protein ZipA
MDRYFTISLNWLAIVVVFAVLVDLLRKRLQKNKKASEGQVKQYIAQEQSCSVSGVDQDQATPSKLALSDKEALFIVSLHPRQQKIRGCHSLLQTFGSMGLSFGAHRLFHYVEDEVGELQQPLFSLADLESPGSFDIDAFETSCYAGFVLFFDYREVADAENALASMLDTAYVLAQSLSLDIKLDLNQVWREDTELALYSRVEAIKQRAVCDERVPEFS